MTTFAAKLLVAEENIIFPKHQKAKLKLINQGKIEPHSDRYITLQMVKRT